MKNLLSVILTLMCIAHTYAAEQNGDQLMKNIFEIKSWDETPYLELEENAKYSRAKLEKQYTGVMNGEGQLEYLMAYKQSGSAYFVGIEHFEGQVNGKQGSLSITHKGSFDNGKVSSTFEIIEGSQTSQLSGLSGKGSYITGHSMIVEFDFDYAF